MKFFLFSPKFGESNKEISAEEFALNSKDSIALIGWDRCISYFIEYAWSLRIFSFLVTFQLNETHKLKQLALLNDSCFFVYPTNIIDEYIFECANAKNCCLFNSEQMSGQRRDPVERFLQKGGKLINYSLNNQLLLANNSVDQMLLMEYNTVTDESKYLFDLYENTEKLYDFCMVGQYTERRKVICESLKLNGKTVCVINNLFGLERDRKIAQCKTLLNIHAFDTFAVYESIRCDRWIAAGVCVISEKCDDENQLPNQILPLHFVPYHNLVDFCLTFQHVQQVKPTIYSDSEITQHDIQQMKKFNSWVNGRKVKKDKCANNELQFLYGSEDLIKNVSEKGAKLLQEQQIPRFLSFNETFGDPNPHSVKELRLFVDNEIKIFITENRLRDVGLQITDTTVHITL